MHSDFRGLLNADFRDALLNCNVYDDKIKASSNYEGVSDTFNNSSTNLSKSVISKPRTS
jgi:hypothetical protein